MALGTLLGIAAAGSVMSAVGSIGGTVANTLTAKRNSDVNYEREQALMEKQSELNQAQWEKQFNMTNAYNSPQNQLSLKAAAGLNPLYSDGNGLSSASPSGSVSLGSVTPQEQVDYSGAFNDMIQNLFRYK